MKLLTNFSWFRRQFLQIGLALLATIAFGQILVKHGLVTGPIVTSRGVAALAYDVALGYFASWIFNVLVVVLPSIRKRRDLRVWLSARYVNLKDSLNRLYLSLLSESWDEELIEKLREPIAFSDFYHERFAPDRTRWHQVHNELYEYGLVEIRRHCELFVSECDLAIGLIGDPSSEFLEMYGRWREALSFASVAAPTYDDIKRLLMILYPLHCPWSFLDGEIKPDGMLKAIATA